MVWLDILNWVYERVYHYLKVQKFALNSLGCKLKVIQVVGAHEEHDGSEVKSGHSDSTEWSWSKVLWEIVEA